MTWKHFRLIIAALALISAFLAVAEMAQFISIGWVGVLAPIWGAAIIVVLFFAWLFTIGLIATTGKKP